MPRWTVLLLLLVGLSAHPAASTAVPATPLQPAGCGACAADPDAGLIPFSLRVCLLEGNCSHSFQRFNFQHLDFQRFEKSTFLS